MILSDTLIEDFGSIDTFGLVSSPKKDILEKYPGILSLWGSAQIISFQFNLLSVLNGSYRADNDNDDYYGIRLVTRVEKGAGEEEEEDGEMEGGVNGRRGMAGEGINAGAAERREKTRRGKKKRKRGRRADYEKTSESRMYAD